MSPKKLEEVRERSGDTLWRPPEGVAGRGCGLKGVWLQGGVA